MRVVDTGSEGSQVVEVAYERVPRPAAELLGHVLVHTHHRDWEPGIEWVGSVDGGGGEAELVGREPQAPCGEVHLRRENLATREQVRGYIRGVVPPPFPHRELEVREHQPIDLLGRQLVGTFFSNTEVEVEGEPTPVAEAVLPQRRSALEGYIQPLVHAALVEAIEDVIEGYVQRRRPPDPPTCPGSCRVCPS